MSDPAWLDDLLADGTEAALWVQAAGTATAPANADMLAFVTDVKNDAKGEVKKRGPHLRSKKMRGTSGGVEVSGSCTIDWSKSADAPRQLLIAAAYAGTRVKITVELFASGEKFVYDQALVDASIATKASEGTTGEFSWSADSCTPTAAS